MASAEQFVISAFSSTSQPKHLREQKLTFCNAFATYTCSTQYTLYSKPTMLCILIVIVHFMYVTLLMMDVCSDHITQFREEGIFQTLWRHPFVWDLHCPTVLSHITSAVHVLCQTKVSHSHTPFVVQPMHVNVYY